MYHVYVIKSKKNGKRYIGFTSKDPHQRLEEHNSGSNTFTKALRPFELIYSEQHEDEIFAKKRERYFKTGHGREFLKKVIPL